MASENESSNSDNVQADNEKDEIVAQKLSLNQNKMPSKRRLLSQFFVIFGLSGAIYYKLNGFDQIQPGSNKSLWLRRLRHSAVLVVPGMIFSPIIAAYIQKDAMQQMELMAEKYREQILNPDFNRRLVSDLKKQNLDVE